MRATVQASLALLLVISTASQSRAQGPFHQGANFIGPSLSLSTYGSTAAFGGHFEHAVTDRVGIGAAAEYFSFGCGGGGVDCSIKYISLAGTAAYHFEVDNKKLDPFVGGALGYNIVSCSQVFEGVDYCGNTSSLLIGAFGGVRYFLKESLAIVGRAGYGLGYLSVGMDFRF